MTILIAIPIAFVGGSIFGCVMMALFQVNQGDRN